MAIKKYDPTKPVLVLIGPSGSGKSAIAGELVKKYSSDIALVPKYTTRPQRSIEKTSFSEDIFVTKEIFKKMKSAGDFIDTVRPFGLAYEYGTPWITIPNEDQLPLLLLRSFVVPLLLKHYKKPIIYQLEIDKATAEQRMKNRGQSPSDIEARLKGFDEELVQGRQVATRHYVNKDDPLLLADKIIKNLKKDLSGLL